jgi:hypothetical protein
MLSRMFRSSVQVHDDVQVHLQNGICTHAFFKFALSLDKLGSLAPRLPAARHPQLTAAQLEPSSTCQSAVSAHGTASSV